MSSLESKIDDLYRLPLGEFVDARDALAKTLTSDDAKRVRALRKPTVVPWAVNQVYWQARPLYERVMKTGEALRKGQVAALAGKAGKALDLRAASEAHRRAIADAVQQAERLAAANESHPAPDALMRTFEALSLAADQSEQPGRLTRPLQPAGFEALAGVRVKAQPGAKTHPKVDTAEVREAAKKEEAARRRREAALRKAESAVERAKQRLLAAQGELKRTRDQTS